MRVHFLLSSFIRVAMQMKPALYLNNIYMWDSYINHVIIVYTLRVAYNGIVQQLNEISTWGSTQSQLTLVKVTNE